MRRLSRTILLLLLIFTGRAVAEPVASLVTVGPGDEVWEKFGHNMIRLRDDERGIDISYNWGVFDFNKPNFILNFVQGRPIYTMVCWRTEPVLDEYRSQNRRVTEQKLNLTHDQIFGLIRRCGTNSRPENADYRYDYFKDNCSTRVRDMLDAVTAGQLSTAMKDKPSDPPVTYRSETLRLTQGDFWVSLGLDFAMGPAGDKRLDRWAEGFLPYQISAAAQSFSEPPAELWQTTRPPPPAGPPTRWPWLMLAGLAGAGAIIGLGSVSRVRNAPNATAQAVDSGVKARSDHLEIHGLRRGVQEGQSFTRSDRQSLPRWRRWTGWTAVGLWWLISGGGGAFMLFMWLLTDHAAAYANQNLWCYSPLAWAALAASVFRFRRTAQRLAQGIVVLSLIGCAFWLIGIFGGPLAQHNGGFILLALPLNLAAAWQVRRAVATAIPGNTSQDNVVDDTTDATAQAVDSPST